MGNTATLDTGNAQIDVTDGRTHVRPMSGPVTQSRNRSLLAISDTYAAATNSVTWSASDNITEITVVATETTAATDDYVIMVVNATSDAAASAALDATIDSATTDVQWYKIPLNVEWKREFNSAVTRLDFLGVSCTPDAWIGAN